MFPRTLEPVLPQATASERELLARAAGWNAHWTWHDLTEDVLRHIAAQEGIDFATALLYDRLVRWPLQAEFLEQLEHSVPLGSCGLLIAVVPGAFYLEDKISGADGKEIMEAAAALGCRTERVFLGSFAGLKHNAKILCEWLERQKERTVLVSLSKGGAEVKLALAEFPEAFRHVVAWIDLSGLHFGTPLMNWLLPRRWRMMAIRFLFWLRGYDSTALQELARGPGRMLDFALQVPEHLRIVHVVGFPMKHHLSRPRSRRGFERIAPMGPNDGGAILLADLARLPGLIYPLWGADHFLRPSGELQNVIKSLLYWVNLDARSEV